MAAEAATAVGCDGLPVESLRMRCGAIACRVKGVPKGTVMAWSRPVAVEACMVAL